MEFRVLGLLEVLEDGRTVTIGRGREAALLALLVSHAGRPLTVDRLIDELWEERPPQNAVKTVQIYVSRLRGRLGRDRIATTATGYVLRAGPEEVDALRAEQLTSEGERLLAAGEPGRAEGLLREAVELWRGDAYADFRFDGFAQAEIARLDELRTTAAADLVDARLELGWADELVAELESLVRDRPLWERPRRQLMLALYRSGRQADALELYQATRSLFRDELGLEPGPELQALERAILNQAPELQKPSRPRLEHPIERARAPGGARGTFVGRSPELEQLLEALEEAVAGRGRLFLVTGEPGIGKSRLADELASAARSRGLRVLVGRCWEGGGAPAFWPWLQALRAYVRDAEPELLRSQLGGGAPELARILPELRERLPELPEPRTPDSDAARFLLFDATAQFLRAVAEATPTLVVLDDLHAADEPSLRLLRFLARELETMRTLVVAAYRDVDPVLSGPLEELQAELAGSAGTSRVPLRGLSTLDVAEYLELTAAALASPALIRRLHEETEGNPLFVSETVRLLSVEAPAGRADSAAVFRVPETVRDVIARRLRHLSPGCLGLLELACMLGREFDLAALAAAAELSRQELLERLDEALDARVVADLPGTRDRLRFAHVLIRDTLHDGLPLARRAGLHSRVLGALEALYGEHDLEHLPELASHALAAGELDRGLLYARRGADHAASTHSYDEAARLYRLALEALSQSRNADERERCRLLLRLGEAETRAGDGAAAKATFLDAAAVARTHGLRLELARAASGYGGGVVWGRAGDDHRLVPLLEEGLRELGGDDAELQIRLQSRLAGALRDEHSRERRDELSRRALELARRAGDLSLLGYALAGRAHAIAGPDTLAECLELGGELRDTARLSGDPERVVAGHSLRIMAHLIAGHVEEAEEELAAATEVAGELRQAVPLWDVLSTTALLALTAGRLDEAEGLIEEARSIGERALPGAATAIYEMQRATLCDFRGGLEELEPALQDLAVASPARPVFRCALAYARARAGRTDSAKRALRDLSAGGFAAVPFDQEWLLAMSFLAETAFLVGDAASSRALHSLLVPWSDLAAADVGEGFRGSVLRYLGLAAAASGSREEARRHYEGALSANERMHARPWLAHTRHDYARLLVSGGEQADRARARELLDRALATYRELGMSPHEERAHELARSF